MEQRSFTIDGEIHQGYWLKWKCEQMASQQQADDTKRSFQKSLPIAISFFVCRCYQRKSCWKTIFATSLLLLLLLSRFSHVQLCATQWTAAHQAPLSLGFSRQEHWSGLPFPSPMHESEKWKWSRLVVSYSSDPMDCSIPGSSIHGIFQARALEWGAIAFSMPVCYRLSILFYIPTSSAWVFLHFLHLPILSSIS